MLSSIGNLFPSTMAETLKQYENNPKTNMVPLARFEKSYQLKRVLDFFLQRFMNFQGFSNIYDGLPRIGAFKNARTFCKRVPESVIGILSRKETKAVRIISREYNI